MHFNTFVSAALLAASAAAQDPYTPTNDLATVISGKEDLSIVSAVLKKYPDILKILVDTKDVTIFAPCDHAFEALNKSGELTELIEDKSAITAFLSYHVAYGTFETKAFQSTPKFARTMLKDHDDTLVQDGQVVELVLDGKTAQVISGEAKVAKVSQADIHFSTGIIQIIDSVLTIPTKVSETAKALNFEAFLSSLESTQLTGTLDETAELTIFAPTNAAFKALGTSLNGASDDQIAEILKYHVVKGRVSYSTVLTSGSVATLSGQSLEITVSHDGSISINNATVVVPNALVFNGVVHGIDTVLMPKKSVRRDAHGDMASATAESNATSTGPDTVLVSSGVHAGHAGQAGAGVPGQPGASGQVSPLNGNATTTTRTTPTAAGTGGYSRETPGSIQTAGIINATTSTAGASRATGFIGAVGALGATALFGGVAALFAHV